MRKIIVLSSVLAVAGCSLVYAAVNKKAVADKVPPDDLVVLTEADVRFSAAHKAALEKRGRFQEYPKRQLRSAQQGHAFCLGAKHDGGVDGHSRLLVSDLNTNYKDKPAILRQNLDHHEALVEAIKTTNFCH